MAVPCNNITECRDGSDENGCKRNELIMLAIVSLILVIVTNLIYHWFKWVYLNWKDKIIPEKSNVDRLNPKECIAYKGDDLADLKVITKQNLYQVSLTKLSKSLNI